MDLIKRLRLSLLSATALGKKGQGALDGVLMVVVGAVSLVIGMIIIAEIFDAVDWETKYSAATNNATRMAFNTTEQMTWTAMGILPIVLLVISAVAVIGAVLVLRGGPRA